MSVCERCRKSQATFHLTDIKPSGEKRERHLCERCAVEEGYVQKPTVKDINEILSSFIASKSSVAEIAELECPECGMTFAEFRNKGLLGCPNDYDVFKSHLAAMIERAHDGAKNHVGKGPPSAGARRAAAHELSKLRRQLSEAVAAEDYERAAELRDRLAELERS